MKTLLSILFIMLVNVPSITEVRSRFKKALNNSDDARWLVDNLASININSQPLLGGYYGASKVLLASHTIWPATKLHLLRTGMDHLNRCIDLRPNEPELRLLRFNLENNIPLFVGYKEHINTDFVFLKTYILKLKGLNSSSLNEDITYSIKNAKYVKEEDKKELFNNLNTQLP